MTTFDDREKSIENRYVNREEFRFKVEARRNKLLGLWAAELMGKSGDSADAYAKEVIASDFEEAGDNDVLRKVYGDVQAAGLSVTREEVRQRMDALLAEAEKQLQG